MLRALRLMLRALPWLVTVVLLAACEGSPPSSDAGADAGRLLDTGPRPDLNIVFMPDSGPTGRPCVAGDACDDGIPCTRDECGVQGFCVQRLQNEMCDDGIFCNGIERCDVRARGCIAGPPQTCEDGDPCTVATCDEPAKACRQRPRDSDADGETDWNCVDGTDCDDRDPARGTQIREVCANFVDDDCDGMVDEADCGRPANDTCDDALVMPGSGVYPVSTVGAQPDVRTPCGGTGDKDVLLTFTLTEASDVAIEAAAASQTVAVALRGECAGMGPFIECNAGFPGIVRRRALAAGTYFVVVATRSGSPIDVRFTVSPRTDTPANETCASPLDLGTGAMVRGSFVEVADDLTTSCGTPGSRELVYALTTTERRDLIVAARTDTMERVAVSIRGTCADGASELRCTSGTQLLTRVHELPPGTWFLVLEGPGLAEPDFALDVVLRDPTPATPGDRCQDALPLPPAMDVVGDLSNAQDDVPLGCGFAFADRLYAFTLDSPRDVRVRVSNGTRFYSLGLRASCESGPELRCVNAGPATAALRNAAAGTYFAVVEAQQPGAYTIRLELSPATIPTPVTGNDSCAFAFEVPAAGGFFTGSTVGLANDVEATCGGMARSPDAVFRLQLARRQRIGISTLGSRYDTVLHLRASACDGAERDCNDDEPGGGGVGGSSRIDQILDAGTYFVIVDGFGSATSGAYELEITREDV